MPLKSPREELSSPWLRLVIALVVVALLVLGIRVVAFALT